MGLASSEQGETVRVLLGEIANNCLGVRAGLITLAGFEIGWAGPGYPDVDLCPSCPSKAEEGDRCWGIREGSGPDALSVEVFRQAPTKA
jgi:hypothetical protein